MDDGLLDTADEIANVASGWDHVDRNRLVGFRIAFQLDGHTD